MNILIAGSSGFIGTALISFLKSQGHHIVKLVRTKRDLGRDALFWDPSKGEIDVAAFDGIDAVINLAGESIFSGRWTKEKKKHILDSRVEATETLVSAMCKIKQAPKVFIQTSAIGFYGNRGEQICDETTSAGEGFLSEVCQAWEKACEPASTAGIRTVIFRFGLVLGAEGGMLRTLLPLFKCGLGSRLGSGRQWMSWIAIDDLTGLFQWALTHREFSGVVNAVSPECVSNATFTYALCHVLHRPPFFLLPAWLLRFVFGREKADALLLSSARVRSCASYDFLYPGLQAALRHILRRQ